MAHMETQVKKVHIEWISRLLQERRQNDRVKLECLFWCLAVILLALAGWQGELFYQDLKEQIEYELWLPEQGSNHSNTYDELLDLQDVTAVTPYVDSTVTLLAPETSMVVQAVGLSEDYIEKVYHPQMEHGMAVLYVNESTYQAVQRMLRAWQTDSNLYEEGEGAGENPTTQCSYEMNGRNGVIKIIPAALGHEGEMYGCLVMDSLTLQKEGIGLKVCFSGRDVDGSQIRGMKEYGYYPSNDLQLSCNEYEKQLRWIRIRDYGIGGMMFLVFALLLRKYGR